ncbi:hypothetical protein GCM10010424_04540 [Streptomyces lienomycini]|uniref:HAD-IIIA family hydrolase n=1 Tax=Streptomyces lienomycini TaxID=284035 RepID=UPI00338188CB
MSPAGNRVKAVLFDRDGTLVHDVPYNGDPDLVRPVEGAREAVALLRAHGIRVGVVTNQSGVARGLISDGDVRRVNRRIDDLIGPFDVWAICPHGPDDGCHCRKPQPGMVLWAAGRVCAHPADCVVIGDIGADTQAAERAGAHGILVPNDRTRPEETAAAAHLAPDLLTAVRAVLDGPPRGRVLADERPIEAAYGTGPGDPPPLTAAPAADRPAPPDGPAATTPGRGVFAPRDPRPAHAEDGPGRAAAQRGGRTPDPDTAVTGAAPPTTGPSRPPAQDARAGGSSAPDACAGGSSTPDARTGRSPAPDPRPGSGGGSAVVGRARAGADRGCGPVGGTGRPA